MSRLNEPIVTGVSPKDGPPGTRVTVRGENFGLTANDLIGLTICGCDCTLSAEWKSPNKIIARSGPGKGPGDIIVTTRQGGEGKCNVKFRGYHETIGPTKESAVWVDSPVHMQSWARRSLSPSSYQQEDPLGLSIEVSDKTIPEDDLNELFPTKCGDLGSESFSAEWFLMENHHATSFEDLKAGFAFLTRKVENQKEGQLSFLKSNVGSVLDQLDTLVRLKQTLEIDMQRNKSFTSKVETKIEETKCEAHKLFEDVLARRERADATRNALSVLQRFKYLFCLPSAIDRNVEKGEYDLIINDYSRVKHLFGNTDVVLFQKYLVEIELRIKLVRETLLNKLENVPPSIDDYIKIIRNIINLEAKEDVPWIGIECFANYLNQSMHDLKDKFIIMESSESAKKGKVGYRPVEGKPPRVIFVEELVDLLEMRLPDLWKLGQTYFGGEFQVEVNSVNHSKFKAMVLHCIQTFCNLLRAAILPHSLGKSSQVRQTYGIWSNIGLESTLPWLPHCLRYFRACYSCYIRIDLPSDALDIFSKLIFDLRLFILLSMFHQKGEEITRLTSKEQWNIDVKDNFGGVTELPGAFEELVLEVVSTTHETVLAAEVRETPLLDSATARKEVSAAIINLFTNFAAVLEILAFVTDEDHGERPMVISQLIGTSDVSKPLGNSLTWDKRLLIVMCNCEYVLGSILRTLWEKIKSCGYPATPDLQSNVKEIFTTLKQKILDQYHEHKCDPLVGTIEPSMYIPKFDWDTVTMPTDVRPYAKEITMNLIGVRSELYRVPLPIVRGIMCKIVETVAEELARLMSCVKGFSSSGSIQAYVDIVAVQNATKAYSSNKSVKFFKEALAGIPHIGKEGDAVVKNILGTFMGTMGKLMDKKDEKPQSSAIKKEDMTSRKRNLTLDFQPFYQANSMKRNYDMDSAPVLSSPDIRKFKMKSPELESYLMQNGLEGATAPTPNTTSQILFPKVVTEEQEKYVKGFEEALSELRGTDSSQGGLPVDVSSNSNSSMTYTDLDPSSRQAGFNLSPLGIVIKDEPQTVPSMGDSPHLSPIDLEHQESIKLERKRKRNRIAASKCRRRKLERISRLENKVKDLKNENSDLSMFLVNLKDQVSGLKREVVDHVHRGCHLSYCLES